MIVYVLPAAVIVPVLDGPVFSATEYPTAPLPVPVVPPVSVIQELLLAAVQPQPVPAVTFIALAPPFAGAFEEIGSIA